MPAMARTAANGALNVTRWWSMVIPTIRSAHAHEENGQ